MSVFSLYWQLSQGRMADFPAFIVSKSFDIYLKLNVIICGTFSCIKKNMIILKQIEPIQLLSLHQQNALAINIERILQAYFSHYANIYLRAEQASVPASRAIVNCACEIFAKRFHCGFAKWPASFAYVRKDFWRNVRDWVRNMHSTLPQYSHNFTTALQRETVGLVMQTQLFCNQMKLNWSFPITHTAQIWI